MSKVISKEIRMIISLEELFQTWHHLESWEIPKDLAPKVRTAETAFNRWVKED